MPGRVERIPIGTEVAEEAVASTRRATMPNVACPGCGRRILLAVDDMTKTIACLRCDTHFNPVTGETVEAPVRARDAPEPEPSYDPVYEPPARPSMAPLFAIVGMLAVVGLTAIVVAVVKSGDRKQAAKKETKEAPVVVRRADPAPRAARSEWEDEMAETRAREKAWLIFWVVFLVLYLTGLCLLLAWVAKDAKNRGIDGGAVWVLVILFISVIGLLVYLASRPMGSLGTCANCHNRRLMYTKHCPHCGHA